MLKRLAFFTVTTQRVCRFAPDRTGSLATYLAFDEPGEAYTAHRELQQSALTKYVPYTC